MSRDTFAGLLRMAKLSIGIGVAKCCTTDTGSMKGVKAMAAKAVLSGDLSESNACGHESLTCKDEVEKAEAEFVQGLFGCWSVWYVSDTLRGCGYTGILVLNRKGLVKGIRGLILFLVRT